MGQLFAFLLVIYFALLIAQAFVYHGYICPRLRAKGWAPNVRWSWGFYADIKAYRRLCCEVQNQDELSVYYYLIILHTLSLIVVIALFALFWIPLFQQRH